MGCNVPASERYSARLVIRLIYRVCKHALSLIEKIEKGEEI